MFQSLKPYNKQSSKTVQTSPTYVLKILLFNMHTFTERSVRLFSSWWTITHVLKRYVCPSCSNSWRL